MAWLNEFELPILIYIRDNFRIDWLTPIVQVITHLADKGAIAILFTLILIAIKKYRRTGVACALSLALDFIVVNLLIKNIVARIRPYDLGVQLNLFENIKDLLITTDPGDWSFPSGHTGSVFAVAAVMIAWMPKRWGIPAFLLAILIALSRLYVGVHYPTDVLAGAIIGLMTAAVARRVIKAVWPKKKKHKKHSSKKRQAA